MRACPSCGQENREGARFCKACGAPLEAAPPSREQRKTVTVLFCDVTGSTALGESTDPEALRAVLARYFERMKGIVESHGGTVEKFIGDAVMAVFGVPQVHEDDALRACRAAVEMRDALPELGVQARIGVNTGEVVTGTEERLATGDAVNVAARLEQAAQPGEILIGDEHARARARRGRGRSRRAARAEGQGTARRRAPARRRARGSRALPREPVRGAGTRGRRSSSCLESRRGGAALRARHRARGCRRREVATRRRGARDARGARRARALPPLRTGDHLLARRRGAEAARCAAGRWGRCGRDRVSARRNRCRHVSGRDRLGGPEAAGGRGAARLRVRRRALGRGDLARPRRPRRPALVGRSDSPRLHGQAGAARAPASSGP